MKYLDRIFSPTATAQIKAILTKKRMLIAGGVIFAVLLLTPMFTYAYYARDINNRERLMNRNNTGLAIKDRHGEVFYEYGKMSADDDIPLSKISDNMKRALIASEDSDFYHHDGFSVRGIAGAMYADINNKNATKYGGSTLTQQLVKNKLLTSNKSFLRKYQEISMAVAIERKYTKDEILDMYLNSVYFGEGAFGINDAARIYFNKSPADLTLAESSMLVGLLPAPNIYSPISGDEKLGKIRQSYVLKRMVEQKNITTKERTAAYDQKLAYVHTESSNFIHAQHYALMVIDELHQKYGNERITRSGFDVSTGLDLSWQKQAESIVQKRVASFASQGGSNAGLVAIDPKTGEVRALVGSVDWNNPQFGKVNMALAKRQPGSSFKPIYYAEAFDKHLITPATIMHDKPTTFGDWTPTNYDGKYRGDIAIRNALATSLNIPAATVMQKLGPEAAASAATRMGITTIHNPSSYGLTLALGTAETELYQMTNAYAAFANQGEQYTPILITSIKDKYGKTVYRDTDHRAQRVQSEQASFLISSILSDNTARAPSYGTSLNIPGREVAVKTGTTNDNKDAWTIGYTPSLAVGVWVGNNENKAMSSNLFGGSSAGMIWHDTMLAVVPTLPNEKFTPPKDVIQVRICKGSELKAPAYYTGAVTEYFISGTEPTGECRSSTPQTQPKKDEKQQEKTNDNNGNAGRGGDTTTTDTTPPPTTTDPGTGGGTTTPPPTTTDPNPTTPPPPPAQ
ncbi:MAG: transglycosylase domain-containing protein [Candidatus Saccharimonadales bacterium]